MALPSSGAISMAQVRAELGLSGPISLGQSGVRTLAGVPSGPISMSQLRGKSAYTPMTVVGYDVYDEDTASGVQYTGSWYPQVAVTAGGSGGFTYLWSFISNAGAFALPVSNAAQARISHAVTKYGWNGVATMNCQITDNTGNVVNKTVNVYVNIVDPAI